jgi:uncharacterized protein YkwD
MVQFPRRFLQLMLAPALVALLTTAAPAATAHGKAAVVGGLRLNASESQLLSYINKARRDAGVNTVQVTPGTTDVARRWALRMATTKKLEHNPDFGSQVGRAGSPKWTRVTENVGYASACDTKQLFDAYMNSAGHRKNILDPKVRYIGLGSVDRTDPEWSCGIVWNAMNFVDSYSPGSYGSNRVPAWGLRVDQYTPATGTGGMLSFENGRDSRMTTRAMGRLAKSAVKYDKPSSTDNAARLKLQSSGTGGGTIAWDIRDAWSMSERNRLTLKAGISTRSGGPTVVVKVTIRDHFDRATYVGSFRVKRQITTQSLALPSSARAFGNTLQLRIENDAVRSGRASGSTLVVYGVGTG